MEGPFELDGEWFYNNPDTKDAVGPFKTYGDAEESRQRLLRALWGGGCTNGSCES